MTAAAPVFDYLCFLIQCLCAMRHCTVSSLTGTEALHIIIINTQRGQTRLKKLRRGKFENNPLKQPRCGLCNRAANQYGAAAADHLNIHFVLAV